MINAAGVRQLDAGDPLPSFGFDTLSHGRVDVPTAFAGGWGALLLYRAHW